MATTQALATLAFAARPGVVATQLGQLMLVVSALTLVPLGVALYEGEGALAWRLALSAGVLGALGAMAARRESDLRMQANEALAVIALSYLASAVAMTFPLMAHGLGVADAFFESVSAVTTTGLSTVARPSQMPRSFLFLRAWMQWYGGLGIVVLSVALLAADDAIARRLVGTDVADNVVTTTRLYARRMLLVYATLTVAALGAVLAAGLAPFDAACHVLAAISTGGFSTYDASLGELGGGTRAALLMGLCVLGALSLPLYLRLYRRDWKALVRNDELWALAIAVVVVAALILVFQSANDGIAPADALILAVSAQTTTGFSTLSPTGLDAATKLIVILAMAIGGSIGSTAGGIKLLRVILALRVVQSALRRTSLAIGAVDDIWLSGHRVEHDAIIRAFMILTLFVVGALLSWLPFLAAGFDPVDALFEVTSAIGTVGLSTGIASSALNPGLKAVLCADMLLGRVEFIAVLALLYPRTWIGRRRSAP